MSLSDIDDWLRATLGDGEAATRLVRRSHRVPPTLGTRYERGRLRWASYRLRRAVDRMERYPYSIRHLQAADRASERMITAWHRYMDWYHG